MTSREGGTEKGAADATRAAEPRRGFKPIVIAVNPPRGWEHPRNFKEHASVPAARAEAARLAAIHPGQQFVVCVPLAIIGRPEPKNLEETTEYGHYYLAAKSAAEQFRASEAQRGPTSDSGEAEE